MDNLTGLVYVLRKENHAQNIAPISDGTEETLILCHGDDSPKLTVTIMPHKSADPIYDEHRMWRDGDGYNLNAGRFTITSPVDDSKLDEHFTKPGGTNKSKAIQLAQRLRNASETFFRRFWLVANGTGEHDHKGRKIPPYGVYVGIEAIIAEYIKRMEEKLLKELLNAPRVDITDVLNLYQDALGEVRYGYKRWEDRGNSDIREDELWNNPSLENLSAAIRAIDKRLEEIKGRLDTPTGGVKEIIWW